MLNIVEWAPTLSAGRVSMRRFVVPVVVVLVVIFGGAYYIGHHPSVAVPMVARSAGSSLVNSVLKSHPISLTASETERTEVAVSSAAGDPALAHTVATAIGSTLPSHFAVPKTALNSVPSALKPFLGGLSGLSGSVSGVEVDAASGSSASGQATVSATVTVAGHTYQVTGTVNIQNGSITGISGLHVRGS